MGLVANLPIALAPGKDCFDFVSFAIIYSSVGLLNYSLLLSTGMGMNAYFTYSVVGFRGSVSSRRAVLIFATF